MSSKLEEMSQGLKELSVADLAGLIEQAAAELRRKTAPDHNGPTAPTKTPSWTGVVDTNPDQRGVRIPGLYRPTKEQVEASLKAIFTPEELAEMGKTDLSKLPPLPKSITEYISEDREDRF